MLLSETYKKTAINLLEMMTVFLFIPILDLEHYF